MPYNKTTHTSLKKTWSICPFFYRSFAVFVVLISGALFLTLSPPQTHKYLYILQIHYLGIYPVDEGDSYDKLPASLRFTGEWCDWGKDGRLLRRSHYIEGKRYGMECLYGYESGKLYLMTFYTNNRIVGPLLGFNEYDNGQHDQQLLDGVHFLQNDSKIACEISWDSRGDYSSIYYHIPDVNNESKYKFITKEVLWDQLSKKWYNSNDYYKLLQKRRDLSHDAVLPESEE